MTKERPILFTGAMVRALLDGTKTQTRRAVKPQPVMYEPGQCVAESDMINDSLICPYGQPGDHLWARETWRGVVRISPPEATPEYGVARYIPDQEHCDRVEYAASQEPDTEPWRPSIHMPRWASRILLEIVSVRVERLQDISDDDAWAEGVSPSTSAAANVPLPAAALTPDTLARSLYRDLWININGPESWIANPFVWVVEFQRITDQRNT